MNKTEMEIIKNAFNILGCIKLNFESIEQLNSESEITTAEMIEAISKRKELGLKNIRALVELLLYLK